MSVAGVRRRFTVKEYHRMALIGILREDDRVELLEGEVRMSVTGARRRFTVKEYHRMALVGILREDDRIELLEGEVIEMSPIGSRHAACVDRLTEVFSERLRRRATIRVQNPIRLGEDSEPQPDLALVQPRPDFYASFHPEPQDVFLLIEVADTSEEHDREVKIPLYARWGIPEVWLVDLAGDAIEVYRGPGPDGYREVYRVRRGESLSIQAFPDIVLAVEEVLG